MSNNNNTENVTTKFKVDVTDLKRNVTTANNTIKLLNAEMKNISAGMDKGAETADTLAAKMQKQSQIVDAEKSKLNALKEQLQRLVQAQESGANVVNDLTKKYQQAAEQYGANSEEAKKYLQELNKAETAQDKNAQAIERLNVQIVNQDTAVKNANGQLNNYAAQLEALQNDEKQTANSTDDLNTSINNTDGDVKKAGDGFTTLKGVMADLIASGIKKAIAAFVDLGKTAVSTYKDMETGSDALIKATGATGEKAQALQANYKSVSKNIVADFGDIGAAIGEVNTRFGINGDKLEDLSTLYLKYANITGENVVSAVDDTQKAMSAYGLGVEDVESFLDALAKVSQDTGVKTSTLTNGIISNAAAFQEMGLSVEQALSFMGQLEKSGANSETVLNGMRKALKSSAENGLDLNESLKQLQNVILNGENGVDGLTAAYDMFGKSGDQIYSAIKTGSLSFENLTKTTIDASGAVKNTYEQTQTSMKKTQLTMQRLKVSAADLIDKVVTKYSPQIEKALNGIKKIIDKVFPAIEKGFNWITKNGSKVASVIVGIGTAITAFVAATSGITALKTALTGLWAVMSANPVGLLVAAIAGLVAAFITLWNTSEEFRNFWIGLWDTVKGAVTSAIEAVGAWFKSAFDGAEMFKEEFLSAWESIKAAWSATVDFFAGIWDGIKTVFSTVGAWFKTVFTGAWNNTKDAFKTVKTTFAGVWNNIKAAFSTVGTWFKTTFETAWTNIKSVFSSVGEFFGGIWDTIKEKFTDVGTKVGEAIGGAFKSVINSVLETVENTINAVPDAINSAIDILNKIPAVDIDHLGYVSLPRLAKGGIVNKSMLANIGEAGEEAVIPLEHNKAGLKKIAGLLAEEMNGGAFGGVKVKGGDTVYNFNQTNNSPKALSRYEIYRQTKNLMSAMNGVR
ncbi:MAG: phage tail tape measure protein [Neisseriaceae bacterium]|nr:phage tail tape measure protein [Neisseriaceae bacterium]